MSNFFRRLQWFRFFSGKPQPGFDKNVSEKYSTQFSSMTIQVCESFFPLLFQIFCLNCLTNFQEQKDLKFYFQLNFQMRSWSLFATWLKRRKQRSRPRKVKQLQKQKLDQHGKFSKVYLKINLTLSLTATMLLFNSLNLYRNGTNNNNNNERDYRFPFIEYEDNAFIIKWCLTKK